MTETKRIGLRFRKSQARILRNVVHRIRSGDMASRTEREQAVNLFEQAAKAASTGEPLIVVCSDPVEAIAIADGFTRWGVVRPAVEELNG